MADPVTREELADAIEDRLLVELKKDSCPASMVQAARQYLKECNFNFALRGRSKAEELEAAYEKKTKGKGPKPIDYPFEDEATS